ncbi:DEAD/DEAH box helicase, partial [Sulfurimonas sp. SAG-AH-194-I05]
MSYNQTKSLDFYYQLTSNQYLNVLDYKGDIIDDISTLYGVDARNKEILENLNKPLDDAFLVLLSRVKVVDDSGVLLDINTNIHKLSIEVCTQDDGFILRFSVDAEKVRQITMINDHYIWYEEQIRQVSKVGENFYTLHTLADTFYKKEELYNVLSRIVSLYNIILVYKNYRVKIGTNVFLKPSVVYEKVENNLLYLRYEATLDYYKASFFTNEKIRKVVYINELEESICICKIDKSFIEPACINLRRMIKKEDKKLLFQNNYSLKKDTFILNSTLAKAFILNTFIELNKQYKQEGIEVLEAFDIIKNKPKLSLNIKSGIDFFEGDAHVVIEDESFALHAFLQNYEDNQSIPLEDGRINLVDASYIASLKRLLNVNEKGIKISFFDMPLVALLLESNAKYNSFEKVRSVYEGFNSMKECTQTKDFKAVLRPYQKEGVAWLEYLYEHNLGGCLADDMGLGKTVQILGLLSYIKSCKPKDAVLIILPVSLLFNWEDEIAKFAPHLTYTLHYGKNRKKQTATTDLVITSYGTLRTDIDFFSKELYDTVILDEAQAIKNPSSKVATSVFLLNAKHRFSMSGTPIENSLMDLYSQFRFLNPMMFGSGLDFKKKYLDPIRKAEDKEVLKELRAKIYPFILRRTKSLVAKDLPKRVNNIIYNTMNAPQAKLYEQTKRRYSTLIHSKIEEVGIQKSQFLVFQAFNELRQIASQPEVFADVKGNKENELSDHLDELLKENHNILIFSSYLGTIQRIGKMLEKKNIGYLSMTGATKKRAKMVQEFNENENIRVFILSLKVGGVGLNLTKADYVFIYDPWWNKASEEQAIDRAHRIGQTKSVFAYKMITKNTIEEKIVALQNQKSHLAQQLISSDT